MHRAIFVLSLGTRTIQIEMSDLAFSPSSITLRVGEKVTLTFKNVGTFEHEFMAGKDPVIGHGYEKDLIFAAQPQANGQHGMDHSGAGVRVQPKGTASLTIIVPADWSEVEFGCFAPAHYEIGMRGKLVIEPGTVGSPLAAPRAGASVGASSPYERCTDSAYLPYGSQGACSQVDQRSISASPAPAVIRSYSSIVIRSGASWNPATRRPPGSRWRTRFATTALSVPGVRRIITFPATRTMLNLRRSFTETRSPRCQ